jgi:hypothetical protein
MFACLLGKKTADAELHVRVFKTRMVYPVRPTPVPLQALRCHCIRGHARMFTGEAAARGVAVLRVYRTRGGLAPGRPTPVPVTGVSPSHKSYMA